MSNWKWFDAKPFPTDRGVNPLKHEGRTEEEVAQHRLGAHPLRLSVTVEDPAEGETCKASREQGLMRCETHLRYPIKPFKIRYKSGKTETYGANYPSINRLMFAVENLLHDFMPLRSEIDAK